MDTRYASVGPCSELPERDVIAALVSRDECAAVFARIASMDNTQRAVRSLLSFLARLATPACAWLDGDLAVELFQEEDGTKVRVMSEIGAGLRERVVPVFTLHASVDAIAHAIEKRRDVLAVLHVERVSARCMLLLGSVEVDESAPMSTEFDISETCLSMRLGSVPAADEVDSGWDA